MDWWEILLRGIGAWELIALVVSITVGGLRDDWGAAIGGMILFNIILFIVLAFLGFILGLAWLLIPLI